MVHRRLVLRRQRRLLVRPHDLAVLPQPRAGHQHTRSVYRVRTAGAAGEERAVDGQNRLVQVQVPPETYRTASGASPAAGLSGAKESRLRQYTSGWSMI